MHPSHSLREGCGRDRKTHNVKAATFARSGGSCGKPVYQQVFSSALYGRNAVKDFDQYIRAQPPPRRRLLAPHLHEHSGELRVGSACQHTQQRGVALLTLPPRHPPPTLQPHRPTTCPRRRAFGCASTFTRRCRCAIRRRRRCCCTSSLPRCRARCLGSSIIGGSDGYAARPLMSTDDL